MSWNVRTIPIRASRSGRRPVTSAPSRRTDPPSGRRKPVIRLKAVVLPAPLGPIRAVIEPRRTAKLAPSTARRPPKRFCEALDLKQARHASRWSSSFFPRSPWGRKIITAMMIRPIATNRSEATLSAASGKSRKRVPATMKPITTAPITVPR